MFVLDLICTCTVVETLHCCLHNTTGLATGNHPTASSHLVPNKYLAPRKSCEHYLYFLLVLCVSYLLLFSLDKNFGYFSSSSTATLIPVTMSYKSFDQLRLTKGLKLMTINARSLEKKVNQLYKLAYNTDYICVTETWYNESIVTGTVNMPGMVLYRTDRPNSI